MARVTWANRDDWARFYGITLDNGTRVTLGDDRAWSPDNPLNDVNRRADAVIARGIAAADRIIVLGCGPGNFLTEALKARGRANCWGVDNSAWANSRGSILGSGVLLINADLAAGASFTSAVRTATGGSSFRWIISDSVWESYDDPDITVGLNTCEGLRAAQVPLGNIIHIVVTPPFTEPGVFNEKTMTQWKAMRATHTWMNPSNNYAVA